MVGTEFAVGIDLNITRFIDLEDRASSVPVRRNRALKNKMSCCHAFRRYITYGEFLKFRTANPRNITLSAHPALLDNPCSKPLCYKHSLACSARTGSLLVAPNTYTPEHNGNFTTASMNLRYYYIMSLVSWNRK